MNIGEVVYNEWHGIRRYGVVMSLEEKDEGLIIPWTYARVKWFNDEPYQATTENTNKLRNDSSDIYKTNYRIDKIRHIDIERELGTLSKIKEYLELEGIG